MKGKKKPGKENIRLDAPCTGIRENREKQYSEIKIGKVHIRIQKNMKPHLLQMYLIHFRRFPPLFLYFLFNFNHVCLCQRK